MHRRLLVSILLLASCSGPQTIGSPDAAARVDAGPGSTEAGVEHDAGNDAGPRVGPGCIAIDGISGAHLREPVLVEYPDANLKLALDPSVVVTEVMLDRDDVHVGLLDTPSGVHAFWAVMPTV